MPPPSRLPCRVFAALAALGCLIPARAQVVVVAEYKGKPHIVRSVAQHRPCVEVNGQRVVADTDRYALRKIDEYLPVFIAVRRVQARTSSLVDSNTGHQLNHKFEFGATFGSDYPLENVFFVLELFFEKERPSLFLYNVGRLSRDHPRTINVTIPTGLPVGAGKYKLHLFVDGVEALHSKQPFELREAALDRLVRKRLIGRADGPPEPLVGPPPEYPERLEKAKTSGSASLRLRIRRTGAVIDPEVISASDPAFGEAALECLRQWRFLPEMKNGKPSEATITLPINFTVPAEAHEQD